MKAIRPGEPPENVPLDMLKQGRLWAPMAQTAPQYDNDGNLLFDGKWRYTWDRENRLLAIETDGLMALLPNAPPRMRIECAYDGQSRRIAKVVKRWQSGPEQWVTIASYKYLYEGWNMLAEIDEQRAGALERAFVWGSDLSGSMQGAGGVGGLLGVYDGRSGKAYNVMTEVNGNVMGLVDVVSGQWVARFDYDAFGNRITAAGPLAGLCPYGFSTKYTDEETGLCYYGYRYYSPELGRWLNRDPLNELGGNKLYCFLSNDGVSKLDYLGLDWLENLGNFVAGVGDSLSAGVTRQGRKAINYAIDSYFYQLEPGVGPPQWEDNMDPSSGWYIAGEVTEIAVEIAVTCGGSALRRAAMKASREALEGGARQMFRRAHNYVGGFIHHWNSIKGHPAMPGIARRIARYPLPFKFAARGFWNMVHVTSREAHYRLHRIQQMWERLDEFREATMFVRQALNRIALYLESNNVPQYEAAIQVHIQLDIRAMKGAEADKAAREFDEKMEKAGIPPELW